MENAGIEVWQFCWGLFIILNSVCKLLQFCALQTKSLSWVEENKDSNVSKALHYDKLKHKTEGSILKFHNDWS